MVTLGSTTGKEVRLELRAIFTRGISIFGVHVGTREDLLEVTRWASSGKIEPIVDGIYGLEDMVEVHRRLDSRLPVGKAVVRD